jgi:DNA-directed RNA polymerase subunit RPC12/RpoP
MEKRKMDMYKCDDCLNVYFIKNEVIACPYCNSKERELMEEEVSMKQISDIINTLSKR